MSLIEHSVARDKFSLDEHGTSVQTALVFPCCCCRHRCGPDGHEPCRTCDHNANAAPATPRQPPAKPYEPDLLPPCPYCGKAFRAGGRTKTQHEEICKWKHAGHSVWVEDCKVCHCEKVLTELFGPHDYGKDDHTQDCAYGCGCWAGPSRSGGPVDPFGACPKNPRQPAAKPPFCGQTGCAYHNPEYPEHCDAAADHDYRQGWDDREREERREEDRREEQRQQEAAQERAAARSRWERQREEEAECDRQMEDQRAHEEQPQEEPEPTPQEQPPPPPPLTSCGPQIGGRK